MFGPFHYQPRQQQLAPQRRDRGWDRQIIAIGDAVDKREFVGIEIAYRPHARQQQRRPRLFAVRGNPKESVA